MRACLHPKEVPSWAGGLFAAGPTDLRLDRSRVLEPSPVAVPQQQHCAGSMIATSPIAISTSASARAISWTRPSGRLPATTLHPNPNARHRSLQSASATISLPPPAAPPPAAAARPRRPPAARRPRPPRPPAAQVVCHLAPLLAPGARVFGATIVQGSAPRSRAAQALMNFYNKKGIFSNVADTG